jgi:hypothetical protein
LEKYVVIAGDLLSPTTSTLQKQGNVVGGNIIEILTLPEVRLGLFMP